MHVNDPLPKPKLSPTLELNQRLMWHNERTQRQPIVTCGAHLELQIECDHEKLGSGLGASELLHLSHKPRQASLPASTHLACLRLQQDVFPKEPFRTEKEGNPATPGAVSMCYS